MIKNVLNAKKFKWQGNQDNIVGGITALNDMKSASQIDPPRVQELPKKRAAVFAQIPEGTVSLLRHWVAVDMNPIDNLVSSAIALASGTQYSDVVTVLVQRARLL